MKHTKKEIFFSVSVAVTAIYILVNLDRTLYTMLCFWVHSCALDVSHGRTWGLPSPVCKT